MAPKLSILALTEDSSKQAQPALRALIKKTLGLVDPHTRTQPGVLELTPPDEATALASHAQRWRSTKAADHHHKISLRKAIATQLGTDHGFVFFHLDGDTPWCKRGKEPRATFEREVATYVQQRIGASAMSRLLLVVPHAAIEAWLYQNTTKATQLCEQHYRGEHTSKFAAWAADCAILDEVEGVKHTTCLTNQHNQALAETAFPAREVEAVGKSYAAFVKACSECAELRAALASTYDGS
jgi:hypothetical protein